MHFSEHQSVTAQRINFVETDLVQVSSKSPKLEQLVFLQTLSETDVVEIIEAVDRVAQGLVILLLDE